MAILGAFKEKKRRHRYYSTDLRESPILVAFREVVAGWNARLKAAERRIDAILPLIGTCDWENKKEGGNDDI